MSQGLVNDRAGMAEYGHDINLTNPDQQLASVASTCPSRTINHIAGQRWTSRLVAVYRMTTCLFKMPGKGTAVIHGAP